MDQDIVHSGRGRISKDIALFGRNLLFRTSPLPRTYASLAFTEFAIGGPFGWVIGINRLTPAGVLRPFRFP